MASPTRPPRAMPFNLPPDTPTFVVTRRDESPTDRDDTNTLFGAKTYGDIARMVDEKLGQTAPRRTPSRKAPSSRK